MIKKLLLLFNTVRHLTFRQIVWQLKYKLERGKYLTDIKRHIIVPSDDFKFSLLNNEQVRYKGGNSFEFLNLTKDFGESINWNFMEFGKLWNYNLEYFDYLNQPDISSQEKNRLINDFYSFSVNHRRRLEPYPVSLRSINVIKYFVRGNNSDEELTSSLYQELSFLHNHYEFHILGNHLLENAFALMLGGAFFKQEYWENKAKKILQEQLDKQVLNDGAHFELSPMYHQIILFRVFELIDWYRFYPNNDQAFLEFLMRKAQKMMGWLTNISFETGEIPHFNDSAVGIAPTTKDFFVYCQQLNINPESTPLSDSGYRSFKANGIEIKLDAAQIGASYQPGHGHSDSLGFIIYYNGEPLFVEQGTSTYQVNERRFLERSSRAHNTVVVKDMNQSQVWSGFRVANRARTYIVEEDKRHIRAYHNGYKKWVGNVYRDFILLEHAVAIKDFFERKGRGTFHLHLQHGISPTIIGKEQEVDLSNGVSISFTGSTNIRTEKYYRADGYNRYEEAFKLIVEFEDSLETKIVFE